jgi:hypothetical protein
MTDSVICEGIQSWYRVHNEHREVGMCVGLCLGSG